MYDSHVHSIFSHDGKSSLEEYSGLIDSGKVSSIGFTEHVDFLPECGGYGRFNYNAWYNAVCTYKSRGYKFYAGAEIGFAECVIPDILKNIDRCGYDYTICSVHRVSGISLSTKKNLNLFNSREYFSDILKQYYNAVTRSLSIEQFDVIGHIGIYKRWLDEDFWERISLRNEVFELENELAARCSVSDKLIEVNSSGLFSPSAAPFPEMNFLRAYYEKGGRKICLGSDAHSAVDVCRGYNDTGKILQDIGFKYVYLPWDRENPIEISAACY